MSGEMTSRERVRAAISFKNPDRTPAAFEAVDTVTAKMLRHYGFANIIQLYDKFEIDIAYITPDYIGPPLKTYRNEKGEKVEYSHWGYASTYHTTATDIYATTTHFPLRNVRLLEELEILNFPDPDWFDYESVRRQCALYKDKAIMIGHEGPFQMVTMLMEMEDFFVLMIEEPKVAQAILDKMVQFELCYYERILAAAEGRIDILRPHDDYGTQISLLFSFDMWREFFRDNTCRLVDLAHKYGASISSILAARWLR